MANPLLSIPIKEASSLARNGWNVCSVKTFESVQMVKEELLIMYLLKDYEGL